MKFCYLIIFVIVCVPAFAQDTPPDSTTSSYLDELVISANKIPEQRRTIAQQVQLVSPQQIRDFNGQNSADVIQNTGVAAMQKSQQGGGSPILRGFEASRVLLMIDGVRMNNLIYRAGHLQNIITVDNNMLDHAEILFGPSSTVYGSDALGGVIHFYTRNPELSTSGQTKIGGNAFFRYGTVNQEKTSHVDFNIGGSRFGSLTSFTYSDFGDLVMGKETNGALGEQFGVRPQYAERAADNSGDVLVQNADPFKQVQSAYKQWDLLQKFLFKQSDRVSHSVNIQYSNSTNVPRYDRLTDPQGTGLRFGEWYYGPQTRLMGAYKLQLDGLGSMADKMTATLSYQNIEESRHDRRFNNNNRNDRTEKVNVMGLTIDFSKTIGKNSLRYGFDGQFNSLKSTAVVTNISTGATSPQNTRYPDGDNTMNMMAIYGSHTLQITDKLTLNDGLRIGISTLKSTFVDKTFFPFPYDNITQSPTFFSGNVGLVYTPTTWKFSFLASTGFRVPNIDDMAKVFESVAGSSTTTGTLVVPNPDLKPEKTLNGDLNITKFFGDKVRLEATFFATDFYDAIVTLPSTLNGQSTVTYGGFPANVVSSQNAQKAYILGYSAAIRFDVSSNVVLTASYNDTKGRVKTTPFESPLDHIAPSYGRIGIQFNKAKLRSELFSNFNGWKHIEDYSASGEDNAQYAHAKGMPSWYTLNLRVGYQITDMFTLQAGMDNIMDLQYRMFASGINSAGRNIFATLRVKF
jgi:hemoglobin/transferrin/lactoferrin receptor protein